MPDWIVQTPVSTIRPTPPKAPAASSGSSIYGVFDDISTIAGGGTTDGTGVTVTLSTRSTVAVFARSQFDGTDNFSAQFTIRVDASPARTTYATTIFSTQNGAAAAWQISVANTGVITLDAGSYLFYTRGSTINNANAVTATAVLTIVVGPNTEQDTFV